MCAKIENAFDDNGQNKTKNIAANKQFLANSFTALAIIVYD
jgi:hypothetical protein